MEQFNPWAYVTPNNIIRVSQGRREVNLMVQHGLATGAGELAKAKNDQSRRMINAMRGVNGVAQYRYKTLDFDEVLLQETSLLCANMPATAGFRDVLWCDQRVSIGSDES